VPERVDRLIADLAGTRPGRALGVVATCLTCLSCGPGKSASSGLVVLNEVACHGRDWVEMVNISDTSQDISGWYISDKTSEESHLYALPTGTIIQASEYLIVKKQEGAEIGFPFGFACGEEAAYLLDTAEDIVDQVDVGDVAAGTTWGHLPNLTGIWRETYPTPGDENEPPRTTE
jgi:hypothetical protein